MKKRILLLAFISASFLAQAQTFETLGHNFATVYLYNNEQHIIGIHKTLSLVEKPNGDILADMYFRIKDPSTHAYVNVRNGFYTLSKQGFCVADSTFLEANPDIIEDNTSSIPLLALNPEGEGYIYVKFLNNRVSSPGWDGFTWLEIYHADENLNFEAEPTMVPLEDTHIEASKGIILENDENLVVRYVLNRVPVLARIGLDGTLKDKQPLPDLFHGEEWNINGIVAYTDSPREYAIYGWDTTPEGDTTFLFHVVDSLFNLKETVAIENNQTWPYRYFNNMISMLPYDDETYYVVSQFTKETSEQYRNGLRIVKYDKASHEELGETLFISQPIYTYLGYCAFPIDLQKSYDGSLYLGYRTCGYAQGGSYCIVRLDTDLNTVWQRFFHAVSFYETFSFNRMKVLDKGVLIGAQHGYNNYMYNGDYPYNTIFWLINDEYDDLEDQNVPIRPYAYYPNPAQSALHLQYSPDVQPACIELYDLQGRLVHKQNRGLEQIGLQGLTSGQYLIRVTMEDGKAYTDKVVKE